MSNHKTAVITGSSSRIGHGTAGIQFVLPVEKFPDEKWQAIQSLNLSSAFYTTKAVTVGMNERKWGRIVNIASAHGLVALPVDGGWTAH